jgi:tRNA nucleotidyltransferase/poly(A) polymerase
VYENAFGTVAVRRAQQVVEITTFRHEHEYADFRRPHRLEFGDDIRADLARGLDKK